MRDARGVGCLVMLSGLLPILIAAAAGVETAVPIFFFLASLMVGWTVFMWHYRR